MQANKETVMIGFMLTKREGAYSFQLAVDNTEAGCRAWLEQETDETFVDFVSVMDDDKVQTLATPLRFAWQDFVLQVDTFEGLAEALESFLQRIYNRAVILQQTQAVTLSSFARYAEDFLSPSLVPSSRHLNFLWQLMPFDQVLLTLAEQTRVLACKHQVMSDERQL